MPYADSSTRQSRLARREFAASEPLGNWVDVSTDELGLAPFVPRRPLSSAQLRHLSDVAFDSTLPAEKLLVYKPAEDSPFFDFQKPYLLVRGDHAYQGYIDAYPRSPLVKVNLMDMSDEDALLFALTEGGRATSPLGAAQVFRDVLAPRGWKLKQCADAIGYHLSTLSNGMRCLALDSRVIEMIERGDIPLELGKALLAATDRDEQLRLAKLYERGGHSIKDIASSMTRGELSPAQRATRINVAAAEREIADRHGQGVSINLDVGGRKVDTIEIRFDSLLELKGLIEQLYERGQAAHVYEGQLVLSPANGKAADQLIEELKGGSDEVKFDLEK